MAFRISSFKKHRTKYFLLVMLVLSGFFALYVNFKPVVDKARAKYLFQTNQIDKLIFSGNEIYCNEVCDKISALTDEQKTNYLSFFEANLKMDRPQLMAAYGYTQRFEYRATEGMQLTHPYDCFLRAMSAMDSGLYPILNQMLKSGHHHSLSIKIIKARLPESLNKLAMPKGHGFKNPLQGGVRSLQRRQS